MKNFKNWKSLPVKYVGIMNSMSEGDGFPHFHRISPLGLNPEKSGLGYSAKNIPT